MRFDNHWWRHQFQSRISHFERLWLNNLEVAPYLRSRRHDRVHWDERIRRIQMNIVSRFLNLTHSVWVFSFSQWFLREKFI